MNDAMAGSDGGIQTRPLDEAAMTALARDLARQIKPPFKCWFEGDLGAGKTTFIRALIQSLGHEGRVKSPTYGLMETYSISDLEVIHLDLYRIADPGELEFLGIEDLFDTQSLLFVEWPDRGAGALPEPDLLVQISQGMDNKGASRQVIFKPHSSSGIELCDYIHRLL